MIEHDTTINYEAITGKPWLRSEDDQVLCLGGTFLTCKIYKILFSEILLEHMFFIYLRVSLAI